VTEHAETRRRSHPLVWSGVVLHGLLIVFFAALLLLAEGQAPPDDANIGAGLAAMPVIALGFPWSLIVDHFLGGHESFGLDLAFILATLPNLGIHVAIIRRLDRL
jgi:hypothetical protein